MEVMKIKHYLKPCISNYEHTYLKWYYTHITFCIKINLVLLPSGFLNIWRLRTNLWLSTAWNSEQEGKENWRENKDDCYTHNFIAGKVDISIEKSINDKNDRSDKNGGW